MTHYRFLPHRLCKEKQKSKSTATTEVVSIELAAQLVERAVLILVNITDVTKP